MKQTVKLNESQLRQVIKESIKKVLSESDFSYGPFPETSWGITIVYSSNVRVSPSASDPEISALQSDDDCINLAKQKVQEEDDIKCVEALRYDSVPGTSHSKSTMLGIIPGKNLKKNPFEDPKFRKWYNDTAHEQD